MSFPPRTDLKPWLTIRKPVNSPVLPPTLLQIYCIGLIGPISYSFWVWAAICDPTIWFYLLNYNAMYILEMIFFRKWVFFQKTFFIKLSYFLMFSSNLKWVLKKKSHSFPYLACCEIKLFSKKKLVENNLLK